MFYCKDLRKIYLSLSLSTLIVVIAQNYPLQLISLEEKKGLKFRNVTAETNSIKTITIRGEFMEIVYT